MSKPWRVVLRFGIRGGDCFAKLGGAREVFKAHGLVPVMFRVESDIVGEFFVEECIDVDESIAALDEALASADSDVVVLSLTEWTGGGPKRRAWFDRAGWDGNGSAHHQSARRGAGAAAA